ncbi:hypothetical protein [Nonomuraea cavernae]|nr:hypothetical protein [Nonomuraea cavernae]MCA2190227.1 hypothetical protein [Nonomuraea cavernae]
MFSKSVKLVAVSALATGAMLMPASAASAAPSSCSSLYKDNAYWFNCTKGTGSFRAIVDCYRIGKSTYTTRYGVWKRVGAGPSIAQCLIDEEPRNGRNAFAS